MRTITSARHRTRDRESGVMFKLLFYSRNLFYRITFRYDGANVQYTNNRANRWQ